MAPERIARDYVSTTSSALVPVNSFSAQSRVFLRGTLAQLLLVCVSLACANVNALVIEIAEAPRPFRVVPPEGWIRQSVEADERLTYQSPTGTPAVTCGVTMAQADGMRKATQEDLTRSVYEPLTKVQMERLLSKTFSQVRVLHIAHSALGGYPARITEFAAHIRIGTEQVYLRAVAYSTAIAPGIPTTFTCAGTGRTPAEAAEAYEYWKAPASLFIGSFKFLPSATANSSNSRAPK